MNTTKLDSIDRSRAYPIPGYDGYSITPSGEVFSIKARFTKKLHRLKSWSNTKGYPTVGLTKDGKTKSIPVHKLQELTFLGGSKPWLQIDHIDGIKTNNDVSNLRQVTPYQNSHNPVTSIRKRRVETSDGHRSMMSISIRKKFQDPVYRKKIESAAQKRINDPKWQEHHASAMKEVWSRPEMREMIYSNLEKMNGDTAARKFNADRSREVNSRPCVATNRSGETLQFPSVTKCAEYFGLVSRTITRYMRDRVVTGDGWAFKRPDKEQK